jgi:hypothetical protein
MTTTLDLRAAQDPDIRAKLEDLTISNRALGRQLGIDESVIRRYRKKLPVAEARTVSVDDAEPRTPGSVPWVMQEALIILYESIKEGTVSRATVRAWKAFYDTLIPGWPTEEELSADLNDAAAYALLADTYPIPTVFGVLSATGRRIQDYIDSGRCSAAMKRAWKNLLATLPQG